MHPVCEVCKQPLTRTGWRGAAALFVCTNPSCSDYGNRVYTVQEQQIGSSDPDRKEK